MDTITINIAHQYTKMKSSFCRSVRSSNALLPVPSTASTSAAILASTARSWTFIIDRSITIADFPTATLRLACFLFRSIRYRLQELAKVNRLLRTKGLRRETYMMRIIKTTKRTKLQNVSPVNSLDAVKLTLTLSLFCNLGLLRLCTNEVQ